MSDRPSAPPAHLNVYIQTIPHTEQRYETVGDYFTVDDLSEKVGSAPGRVFRISEMDNPDYEFLVMIHEIIESHLVQKRGISDAAIDAFDIQFEKDREAGKVPQDAEAGDSIEAPYYREHRFATTIERLVAYELGVDWMSYDNTVMSLGGDDEK
jgi:hypothetical protein